MTEKPASPPPAPRQPWWRRGNPVVVLVAVAVLLVLASLTLRAVASQSAGPASRVSPGVTLGQVMTDVRADDVRGAVLDERHQTLTVTYPDDAGATAVDGDARAALDSGTTSATVTFPAAYSADLTAALVHAGVPLTVLPSDPAAREAAAGDGHVTPSGELDKRAHDLALAGKLAGFAAAAFALVALAVWGRRRLHGSAGPLTLGAVDVPDTRFADVAGADEAVADLKELVEFLKEPERFTRLGASVPKGALLCGPPGTGKTLLARAVAGEAGVPFFTASGSDFVEMYVGVGAKRVRELFDKAGKAEKAIVFIDEIDALARKRSGGDSGGAGTAGNNTEHEGTLVALLTELDGFADRGTIVVLAATNRADVLDPALTRPGRLDRKIEVPNPDRRGREAILAVHGRRSPLADDVDLTGVARRTPGFSGAQMGAIVNEAALEAVRRELDAVDADCFDHAVATIAMGRARTSALVTEHDRRVTAWHEAGHTVAALLLPDADDPVQVTIVPRGPAGGVTWMAGNDDLFLGRRTALSQMIVALAGRAGEEALLDGEYTQGAAGDLQSATSTALQLATQFGMTRLGYMVRSDGVLQAGGMTDVNEVVEELLVQAHAKATELVTEHRALLAAVAEALLDVETLTLAQVRTIADGLAVAVPTTMPLVDATPWKGEAPRVTTPRPVDVPPSLPPIPAQRRPSDATADLVAAATVSEPATSGRRRQVGAALARTAAATTGRLLARRPVRRDTGLPTA